MTHTIREAAIAGCERWKSFFNAGDAPGCASCYEKNASLIATPFGTYVGQEEIEEFWAKLMAYGFENVSYADLIVREIDENTAIVSGSWVMNKVSHTITHELWVLQSDGKACLREIITRQSEASIEDLESELRNEVASIWDAKFREDIYPSLQSKALH